MKIDKFSWRNCIKNYHFNFFGEILIFCVKKSNIQQKVKNHRPSGNLFLFLQISISSSSPFGHCTTPSQTLSSLRHILDSKLFFSRTKIKSEIVGLIFFVADMNSSVILHNHTIWYLLWVSPAQRHRIWGGDKDDEFCGHNWHKTGITIYKEEVAWKQCVLKPSILFEGEMWDG